MSNPDARVFYPGDLPRVIPLIRDLDEELSFDIYLHLDKISHRVLEVLLSSYRKVSPEIVLVAQSRSEGKNVISRNTSKGD